MIKELKRVEFLFSIIIAILLIGSLLSQKYFQIPYWIVTILLAGFIITKTIQILKKGGTIFEDYVSLAIILIFGILHFMVKSDLNPIVITVLIFVLIYSVGLIPWFDQMITSKKIITFIFSYAFFIIMIVFLFSGAFFANNLEFVGNGNNQPLTFAESLYFSTITFTTVGYGDITPIGTNRLIASIEAIIAIILNIAFIGYILSSRRFKTKD